MEAATNTMAHQQYQMPQAPGRPYSPPQSTSSPSTTQGFPLPPNKRQRVSPDPRAQPTSPYVQSPYTSVSPNTTGPPSTAPTPHFSNISLPPNIYNTPYANGHSKPTINLPATQSNYVAYQTQPQLRSQHQSSSHINAPNGNSFSNNLHPNNQFQNSESLPSQASGMMGPPSKPVERDNANDDQMDVLANAGVDLRAEESFAMSFHTGSFNSQPAFAQNGANSMGHAFTQFSPGDAKSFYGSGPANQIGQPTDKASQDQLMKKTADKAWTDAALSLARSRQHELSRPHVNVATVWGRMDRIARENGLILNTDGGKMPQLKLPSEFQSEIRIQAAVGPQGAMTVTGGRFLPADTALADQLALMSLATNLRLRTLLEDAVALAKGRRTGSHGVAPPEWADVSAPSHLSSGTMIDNGASRNGWESAVSPRTNPFNHSLSSAVRLPTPISDGVNTPTRAITYTNELVNALRNVAEADREFEEARLLKRQSRLAGDSTPRAGSVAPGTPGSVAPEPSAKPLTKKEREKQDKGKQSVADSHAQANATTQKFLFGTKSKNKYAWMNGGGGGGSGTTTPSRINTQGLQGTPAGISGGPPEKQMLTVESSKKWGLHREDRKDQPLLVEMRDILVVLENDGKEVKTLQDIYAWLENPRSRKP